jgi:ATP/maltotriose-dependent transcriptional regulator MalT
MMNVASTRVQPDSLLTTKLHVPQVHPNLVPRPGLIARLNERRIRSLTLISAPAGFGKTTLLGEWVPQSEHCVAWVALDEGDNDPIRFWNYLIAGLQRLHGDLGQHAQAVLRAQAQQPQSPAFESVLIALLNECAAFPDEFALVLDDYHIVTTLAIHQGITYLVDHLPPNMHLILTSRSAPPLPLARWRARSQLIELRAEDLRFTPDEAATFLNRVMGLNLSGDDIAALAARTEGWIVGLQMAALSMQGREDRHGFVSAFTGSQRYILDYLTEEVLNRQPENVQTFLLHTSILDRLSGPLCDAVMEQVNSREMLESLERANLFITPLDEEWNWYRYHHLFAEVLRHRLHEDQPELVPELHHRASLWYERNGWMDAAIEHALAAGAFERAAGLIEQVAATMWIQRERATLLHWLEALPDDLVRSRPSLSLSYAWALLFVGQIDGVETRLQDVERGFEAGAPNRAEVQRMVGYAAVLRSLVACYQGEVSRAVTLSRQALASLPPEDLVLRGVVAINLALNLADAYRAGTQVAEANRILAEAAESTQSPGNILTALPVLSLWGELEMVQGKLHHAGETYRRALQLASEYEAQSGQPLPSAGAAYLGLADLLREWNELDVAQSQASTGIELGQLAQDWRVLTSGVLTLARIQQAQGDLDGAFRALDEAAQFARRSNITWLISRVAAYQARLGLAQGNLKAAVRWAQECGLSTGDEIGYQRESEYTTLARVYLAQGQVEQALELLAWLRDAMENAGLGATVVEVLMLQALSLQAQGNTRGASDVLERALSLAQPEGYIRLFVDEGTAMARLLRRAVGSSVAPHYVDRLREALGEAAPATTKEQPLAEPLTERELEVLRLIAAGLSNQAMAAELFITVGTVKRHLTNIYGKLGVSNRVQAVEKGRALNLLPR